MLGKCHGAIYKAPDKKESEELREDGDRADFIDFRLEKRGSCRIRERKKKTKNFHGWTNRTQLETGMRLGPYMRPSIQSRYYLTTVTVNPAC